MKKVDGGIGVPIDAEIVELSQLSPSPKLKFLVDGAVQTRLTDLESMYYDLRTTSDAIRKFLKRNLLLSKDGEKQIGALYGKVFKITETFNSVIASIDLNVFSAKGTNQFKKAFDAYQDGGTMLPDKFIRYFKTLAAKLEQVRSLPSYDIFMAHHFLISSKMIWANSFFYDRICYFKLTSKKFLFLLQLYKISVLHSFEKPEREPFEL